MLEKIKKIICEFSEIDPDEITPHSFIRDLGLNSYDLMNVVAACEEEFSVVIAERDIHRLETIEDIIDYIKGAVKCSG
jgi:acyl carrier protein